jgi:hypothetical protein
VSEQGPVSALLHSWLRDEVRKHGIVFLLDQQGTWTSFIDRLMSSSGTSSTPFPVCAWRGSFLQLLIDLEPYNNGVDRMPLLVHLPGFTHDDVRASPLLALFAAGTSRQKALDTLITDAAAGRVRPDEIAAFKASGPTTLAVADEWLQRQLGTIGEGLSAHLGALSLEALIDDLLAGGFISQRLHSLLDVEQVWAHMARTLGLNDAWRTDVLPASDERTSAIPRAKDIAFAAASWALLVEYAHDLRAVPGDQPHLTTALELPKAVADAGARLATHLRQRSPEFYARTATETETRLFTSIDAAQLGDIDTFPFEEEVILEAAVDRLSTKDWNAAIAWARPRAQAKSFWTQQEPLRQNAWQFVLDAATLGKAIVDAGALGHVASLDEATERYALKGAAVDRAHRTLEQRRLHTQVPYFERLRARLNDMRALWRQWADAWASDWNAVCREHGFLPSPELQQRQLFEQVVRPLAADAASPDVTAYFMVDALRYEMAQELFDALGDLPATQKQLKARLAELPTVTEVGMNVLAPVARNGKLSPAIGDKILGFSAGEFRVHDPETRRRAIFDRVGGRGCPLLTLRDVLDRDAAGLKRTVEQSRMIVVHSKEIDDAGEAGRGVVTFDSVLQDLRAAWRLLREAGVRRFVITADHGFLLLDERFGVAQSHGRKIDPHRRHVLSETAADHSDEVRVALKDLDYEGVVGHVMFPETVAVFNRGGRGLDFAHGGNSPQERVIPVLTLVHRQPIGSDTHRYAISAAPIDASGGMHGISGLVTIDQTTLFGGRQTIELGLRVIEVGGVAVELLETRRHARLAGSVIHARVGEPFEVFFRLVGFSDERVRVELVHTGGEAIVDGAIVAGRFTVTPPNTVESTVPTAAAPPITKTTKRPTSWTEELPAGGVRQVFEHLQAHGAITETEASAMLGGPRQARRFANDFDIYAAKAPFRIRIDVAGSIKRYVREGSDG